MSSAPPKTAGFASDVAGAASDLHLLLRPRSIAIVGASEREDSFGQRLLRAVKSGGYQGCIHPINPRYEVIDELRCFPDFASLPETPDCAAFAVSDEQIETALAEAGSRGVRGAVIFGRVHDEPEPGKTSRVDRLAEIARGAGMAVCGNNCMGFINVADRLKVSGNPPPISGSTGSIGLISHSGSTWSGLIGNQRGLNFNYAISAGQEIVTTMADYLNFLLEQPETRVIGCIVEAVRDPAVFLEAVERADRLSVPIVVLKLGRSDRGRELALAHSGALTGSDNAYRAVFERRNVVLTDTPDEFADVLELFGSPRRPTAPGIGIVTDSGGERELIVDLATKLAAPLADIAPQTASLLQDVLDPGMMPVNPVDSYGDGRTLLRECLSVLAGDPNVGIVALATNLVHGRPYLHQCGAAIEAVHAETEKPALVFGNLHSSISREEATRLRERGIPVLMGTSNALLAMKHLGEWQRRRSEPAAASPYPFLPADDVLRFANAITSCAGTALAPEEGFRILDAFGIATVPSIIANTRAEASDAAARLGFPVVLKTANPDILHKTEYGGVVTRLLGRSEIEAAYDQIAARCGPRVLVQSHADPGVEILLGMTHDQTFGPMVTIGLGGVLTEILGDAITVEPPITAEAALQHLSRLKGYRLLQGYRGGPTVDLDALAYAIERFSLLCQHLGRTLDAVELNPVLAGPGGAVAVDALFLPKNATNT